MNFFRSVCIKSVLIFVLVTWLTTGYSSAQKQPPKTVKDLYPGLASGILNSATPADLPKGTLLTAGALTIKESDITKVISQSEPEVRKQLTQNAFFLLENMATQKLLLEEAKKAGFVKGGENNAISDFILAKIKVSAVTEEEIKNFHNENKMIANAPLEQLRETIKDFLTRQKQQEAVQTFILTLGQKTPIQVNEDWVKKQSVLVLNNPVDRARRSGKPTLVEFGASGCVPCDMMAPILADLRKRFPNKLNILFVHVGQEKMLGVRFGIQGIPVQVFFDKNGKEVFRHTGFFPQNELEKKMSQLELI